MVHKIRKVSPDWEHPKDEDGEFISLEDWSYLEAIADYLSSIEDYVLKYKAGDMKVAVAEWTDAPSPKDCFPDWTDEERTHLQIYTEVTGTPVSPIFADAEELMQWLHGVWVGRVSPGEWPMDQERAKYLRDMYMYNIGLGHPPDGIPLSQT